MATQFEIGKIYTFPNKDGAFLYKGGEPSNADSWEKNILSGAVSSVGSGALYSFQDELAGGARGMLDPDLTRQQGIDLERRAIEDYRSKYPLKSLGYEVGGAVVPAILSGGTSAPLSTAKIGASTIKAAGQGGLYGIGSGEGATDRISKGVISAGLGAGGGLATSVLAKPVSNIGSMISSSFASPTKLGQKEAVKLVKDALEYDKTDINSAIKYILDRSDKSYALADIGANSRAYLDAVNVIPGIGKTEASAFLTKRNGGALERIKGDLTDAFGEQGSYFHTYKAVEAVRKANGDKMYKKAFQRKVPVTPKLTELFQTNIMQKAIKTGYEIANARKIKLPRLQIVNGQLRTEKGNLVKDIDTEFLHYLKLGLDDEIFTGKMPNSGLGKTLQGANSKLRYEFLDYLDSNNPDYKLARNQWAGQASILDALEEGRNFIKPSNNIDELTETISKMSQSEKLAFRNGAINTIIDKMESSIFDETSGRGANIAFNILKTPRSRTLLRLTFPEGNQGQKTFDKFISKLNDEVEIKTTANAVLGNSATMGRAEAVSSLKNVMTPTEVQNLSHVGIIYGLFKSDFDHLSIEAQKAASEKLVKMLTATDPKILDQIKKEVLDKGLVKGILTKFIPNTLSVIGKLPFDPTVSGITSGAVGRPISEGGSQSLQGILNQ